MQRYLLTILLLIGLTHAQSRNDQVRTFNRIINFMDECSRVNRSLFYDAEQFAAGYVESVTKNNNNYWYTNSRPDFRIGSFALDKGKYPELNVDDDGMVIDFEYELYDYLVAKEEMDTLNVTDFFTGKESIYNALIAFRTNVDSLVTHHRRLYEYVNSKAYLSDNDFDEAKDIIKSTEGILDSYHHKAQELFIELENYYLQNFPPYNTKQVIRDAQGELKRTIDLMREWEHDLWLGNEDKTPSYDMKLHDLNDEAMTKDSIYLSGTYGFKISNNGAMPHTRYCTFYSMMKATLYWYAKDKRHYYGNLIKRDVDYNEYVHRSHMVVEDYNDFVECADGKQLAHNLHYKMKQAGKIGIDTCQNVLLGFPRWGYLFHLKPIEQEHSYKDSVVIQHKRRIQNADPHHMIFLLDASASMHKPGKLDLLKEGAKYLVNLQRNTDHISVLSFATHSHILMEYVTCDKKSKINHTLDQLRAKGATNANEGLKKAFGIADSNYVQGEKRKIILVTDGKFQLDNPTKKLLKSFKKNEIELCILWVGDKDDPGLELEFKKISSRGNGRYYRVNEDNLHEILVEEASE